MFDFQQKMSDAEKIRDLTSAESKRAVEDAEEALAIAEEERDQERHVTNLTQKKALQARREQFAAHRRQREMELRETEAAEMKLRHESPTIGMDGVSRANLGKYTCLASRCIEQYGPTQYTSRGVVLKHNPSRRC